MPYYNRNPKRDHKFDNYLLTTSLSSPGGGGSGVPAVALLGWHRDHLTSVGGRAGDMVDYQNSGPQLDTAHTNIKGARRRANKLTAYHMISAAFRFRISGMLGLRSQKGIGGRNPNLGEAPL